MTRHSIALALCAGLLALGLVARNSNAGPMAATAHLGNAAAAMGIVKSISHDRLHICRRYRGSQRCHWVKDKLPWPSRRARSA